MADNNRLKGVKVTSYKGGDRGTFDSTHIVGSEVIRGVDREAAIDRAFRTRNVVELASKGAVTTDSIRFVLDGLRDVKPGDHLSDDQVRLFKEYVQNTESLPIRRSDSSSSKSEKRRTIDLGKDTGETSGEGGMMLVGPLLDFVTRTRIDCQYVVIARETVFQPYVKVSDLEYVHSSEMFTTSETDRLVEELKVVLEQQISNEVTYNEFGASATLTGTALEQFLREYVQTNTFLIVHYMVTVSGTVTLSMHSIIKETWAWVGDDCPEGVGRPEIISYTLEGPEESYDFTIYFEEWEKKALEAWISGEEWAQKLANKHLMHLINTGAWVPPDIPTHPHTPSPPNFD